MVKVKEKHSHKVDGRGQSKIYSDGSVLLLGKRFSKTQNNVIVKIIKTSFFTGVFLGWFITWLLLK